LLGIDPWVVANEGKLLVVVSREDADQALRIMRSDSLGIEGAIIGEVDSTHPRKVIAQTRFGTYRIVPMPTGELLPRIC
jgi:hydrogenase expression/formation protein HypE